MSIPKLSALALVAALVLTGVAVAEEAAESSPLVVKIHADWCGTCQRLGPTWKELQERHGGAVQFEVLDVTSQQTSAAARARAEQLGIAALFERYARRTGSVLVVHSQTRELIEVLAGETDVSRYDEPLARARAS